VAHPEVHDYRCADCGKRGHNARTCPGDQTSERPIIFSATMVRAILAGTKSVTRRLVNLETLRVGLPKRVSSDLPGLMPEIHARPGTYTAKLNQGGAVTLKKLELGVKPGEFHFACPYAAGETHIADYGGGRRSWAITPFGGQTLWVRETWRTHELESDGTDGILFAADDAFRPIEPTMAAATAWVVTHDNDKHGDRWRSPIHMPRWASRITLNVIQVRLERLQAITEADAKAEGVRPFFERFPEIGRDQRITSGELARDGEYRASYAVSWDEINADRATWRSNPFIWTVSFTRAETR
jgi:hypothetical protein